MVTAIWPRRRHLPAYVALSTLLCASNAKAELFYTARSPAIQDGLINKPASICPVAQDGATTDTFPWTHNPTCVDVVMPNEGNEAVGAKGPQTFCTYTNADYNNGRGVSLVVTPEVAASVTMETFGMSIGGMEGVVGENMGMWEVKYAGEKGKGLFAKKDIAGIFPGESLIVQTPVLFVARPLAETENRPQHVLKQAVEQLPAETREMVKALDVNIDGSVEDIVLTNGVGVKWPWVDELPELLAVIPEAARINHACRPNTLWRFDDYTLSFEVFALRDIKPGEEITRSYGYEKRPRRRRVKTLMANFGFQCACPLCTADDDAVMESNDRLSEIKALKSVLPTDEKDSPQLLGLLPKLIEQLEQEELFAELPQYEEILAYTWSSFGIEDRARYWAERAQKHWAVVAGKESWEQRRCGELAENVRGHSTWMTWEGDPWEGVGQGHPWDEKEGEGHEHGHEH